jgi:uncharacterized protein YgiM (DUF1202 family)
MKVTAFFLCVILLASCKKTNNPDKIGGKLNTELINNSDDLSYAQIGFKNRFIDLGKIVPFDNNQILHFTNEGDTTLIINEVYAENEHFEVFGFTYEVAPGGEGKIRLRINPSLEVKSYTDFIFIKTNTNNTSSLARLTIKYELSDDLIIGGSFVEEGDRINVRMFPSLDATVLFGLEKGDEVKCIGAMHKDYVEEFDADLWYYVDYKGRKGWVLSVLTDFNTTGVVAMDDNQNEKMNSRDSLNQLAANL